MSALAVDIEGGYFKARLVACILGVARADTAEMLSGYSLAYVQ